MEKRPALSKTTYFSCSQKVPELCMFAMHLHNSASALSKFGYCSAVGSQRLAKLVWRERNGGTSCPAEPHAAKLFREAGNRRLLLQCPVCPPPYDAALPTLVEVWSGEMQTLLWLKNPKHVFFRMTVEVGSISHSYFPSAQEVPSRITA